MADSWQGQDLMRAAFEQHYPRLVRLSVLLTGDEDSAKDLVQEAFVRVGSRMPSLDDGDVLPYLRRVVINLWRSRWRRFLLERRAMARIAAREAVVSNGWIEDRDEMWSLIRRLPPKQRACLVLRYYEELSERATARVLGCSVGTVKSQTSRALMRLRKELSEGGD